MRKCHFCGKFRPNVAVAQICPRCAVGRIGDEWCDFCKKTTRTEIAWICDACAKGRSGDAWCDFCKSTTHTRPARICNRCSA